MRNKSEGGVKMDVAALLNLDDLGSTADRPVPTPSQIQDVNEKTGWVGDGATHGTGRESSPKPSTPSRPKGRAKRRRTTPYTGPAIAFRTRPEVAELIDDLAYKTRLSKTELLEHMLEAYCAKNKHTEEAEKLATILAND